VLVSAVSACPEGHVACRVCYVAWLGGKSVCPTCEHATDERNLVRNRSLDNLIDKMHMRCKNSAVAVDTKADVATWRQKKLKAMRARERENEAAAPPPESEAASEELEQELEQLMAMQKKNLKDLDVLPPHGVGAAPGPSSDTDACKWTGFVGQHAEHLDVCEYQPLACSFANVGCTDTPLRKDAQRHEKWDCDFRTICPHCCNSFAALHLHEGRCQLAEIECPNAGCGKTVARRSMTDHRDVCGREEVWCPFGCRERMPRAGGFSQQSRSLSGRGVVPPGARSCLCSLSGFLHNHNRGLSVGYCATKIP
jgi:hypothetical protein